MELTPEQIMEEESSDFLLQELIRLMEEDEQANNQGNSTASEGDACISTPTEEDGESHEEELPTPAIPELRSDVPRCPICEAELINDHCKLICRSETCINTVVQNCNEY